jgi:hypothetical protein
VTSTRQARPGVNPYFDDRIGNMCLPSHLSGLTSVKTADGQAFSGPAALSFIRKLRN